MQKNDGSSGRVVAMDAEQRGPEQELAEEFARLRRRVEVLEEDLANLRRVRGVVQAAPVQPVAPAKNDVVATPAPYKVELNPPSIPQVQRAVNADVVERILQGPGEQKKADAPPAQAHGYDAPSVAWSMPRFGTTFDEKPKVSLESRLGSQVFNRVGVVAILIGIGYFLKLAIDNHWIGPSGQVLIVMIAGAAVIWWSERFRRKGFAVFSYSLKAVGSAALYLALWASFHRYHLLPAGVVFGAMFLITAWNAWMAWAQDSEMLAAYALAGGFSTPLLVSTGENHAVFLFSYLLVLNVAVVSLLAAKPWPRLLAAAMPSTIAFYIGWYGRFYSDDQFWMMAFFTTLFFCLYAGVALIRVSVQSVLLTVLLPIAGALFGSLAMYSILEDSHRHSWLPWVSVLFAAFYLVLMRVQRRLRPNTATEAIHLTLTVLFLTIAVPLKATGHWITIGWMTEGAALFWMSTRMKGAPHQVSKVMQLLAFGALALGYLGALTLPMWTAASATAFWNARFATEIFAAGAMGIVMWLAAWQREEKAAYAEMLEAICGLSINVLLLLAIGREIFAYYGDAGEPRAETMFAAYLMMHGTVLFGVLRRQQERIAGPVAQLLRIIGVAALAVGAVGIAALPLQTPANAGIILNTRFATEILGLLLLGLSAWLTGTEKSSGERITIAQGCVLAINALIGVAVYREMSAYFEVDQGDRTVEHFSVYLVLHGTALLGALAWTGSRTGRVLRHWLRLLACGVLAMGFVGVLLMPVEVASGARLLLNAQFAAELSAILLIAAAAWLGRRVVPSDPELPLVPLALVAMNLLILVTGYREIFRYWLPDGVQDTSGEHLMFAEFTFSALMMAQGAILLAVGFWKRSAFVRWQALVLLTVTIGKVFLYDTRNLSQGYRVLSFLGLGVLLMTISFAYQKDWLALKAQPVAEEVDEA